MRAFSSIRKYCYPSILDGPPFVRLAKQPQRRRFDPRIHCRSPLNSS